jgi:hypothetical protein
MDVAGENVLATDYATHGCMSVDLKAAAALDDAQTALFTQVTADVPWETVVFQSFTGARDFVVLTRHAVWRVGKGHITKLAVSPAPPESATGAK